MNGVPQMITDLRTLLALLPGAQSRGDLTPEALREVVNVMDAELVAIARLAGPPEVRALPIYTLDDVVREARTRAHQRALHLVAGTDVHGLPQGDAA
jgi:hypothetical protein